MCQNFTYLCLDGIVSDFNVGKVLESSVLMDKMTGKSRGFGFVVFEDEDAADKVCALRNHEICEKTCEVRKAEPRSALMNRKEREAVAAAGYRNQIDMTRQQQAPPTNSVDGKGFLFVCLFTTTPFLKLLLKSKRGKNLSLINGKIKNPRTLIQWCLIFFC